MMRDIKFRAWDGERLRSVWTIGWIDEEMDYISTPKFNAEEFTLMQFTGMKDKNGVDIYEGDVWKIDGLPQVVEMIDGCWQAVGRTAYGDIYDKQTFDLIRFQHIEVIGNIYENAHLLNETEG